MAKHSKSNAELKAENTLLRRTNTAAGITSVFNNIVRFGAIVLIFRYGYLSVEALAGKTTLASIWVNFLANITVSQSVAYIFGASGVTYGVVEHWLRKKTIKRFKNRIPRLEAKIDSGRTSSRLNATGETHPRDQA